MSISEKLKELRKEKGKTQKEIAHDLGISATGYANWEQGYRNPSILEITRLSKYFNESADYLLGLSDDYTSAQPPMHKPVSQASTKKHVIRLRELRDEKGLSQKQLAEVLGYTQGSISEWERGATEPSIENILRLCEFFDVSTDCLLGISTDFDPIKPIVQKGTLLQPLTDNVVNNYVFCC